MRIVTAHNFYQQPGGEDVVFESETALLRERGHEVFEYCEHNAAIAGANVFQVAVGSIWSWRAHARLTEVLRAARPDVVHFHNVFPLISPAAYYASRDAGAAVVQTLHNYRLGCPKASLFRDGHACEDCLGHAVPWSGIRHACYRGSRATTAAVGGMNLIHELAGTWREAVDVYIALSEFARTKHLLAGFPAAKLVVKPNFVFPDPGTAEGHGGFALFAGRLTPEKGVGTLVRGWRQVTDLPLKIVGDGPQRPELEAVVQNAGLMDRVELLGRQPRTTVLDLMRKAQFVVFPSESYENFPVTIAEAFACATPVIASRLGAMAEVIADGQTGLLFAPGDADDLAAKVIWATTHRPEISAMGHRGRAEFEAKYTADRNYTLLVDIYDLALARARQRLKGSPRAC